MRPVDASLLDKDQIPAAVAIQKFAVQMVWVFAVEQQSSRNLFAKSVQPGRVEYRASDGSTSVC